VVLEPAIGSARFAALVAELLLLSQALLTLAAAGLAAAAPALFGGGYRSTCAIGFSGVLFALKVRHALSRCMCLVRQHAVCKRTRSCCHCRLAEASACRTTARLLGEPSLWQAAVFEADASAVQRRRSWPVVQSLWRWIRRHGPNIKSPTSHMCACVQVQLNARAPGVETIYGMRVPAKVPL
jgi:hypothetical protein